MRLRAFSRRAGAVWAKTAHICCILRPPLRCGLATPPCEGAMLCYWKPMASV